MAQTIDVTTRKDNGLHEATSGSFKATSTHSQDDAVERLSIQIRDAVMRGDFNSGQ